MNAYQVEKCRRIVSRKGFDTQQDKLVDECERLIETAQGDDYDTFITALANVRIIVEQMKLSLDRDQREIYFARLSAEINRQYNQVGGFLGISEVQR